MTSIRDRAMRVVVVGGGIGGLAAALALSRLGIAVTLLGQSSEIAEIGAGLQLGPMPLPRSTLSESAIECGKDPSLPNVW